jgi:hypothetical protein
MKIAGAVLWVGLGFLAYGGQLAHERIDRSGDALCRSVNSNEVCDDRLAVDKSFFLIWGLAGGPFSFIWAAATTGFFHAGFQFS